MANNSSCWYCPKCKEELDGCHVTYQELCEYCGTAVLSVPESISQETIEEIIKAKAEGRLVVLKQPMIPLVASDDPMDSDVYCPSCGESLSGGWPNYHTDQEWKMCQCFYCGQSIDDTKVITREAAEKALTKGAEHHEV